MKRLLLLITVLFSLSFSLYAQQTDDVVLDVFYRRAGFGEEDIIPTDREYIEVRLKAYIAELLYGYNGRHYIYSTRLDYMFKEAIAIAEQE